MAAGTGNQLFQRRWCREDAVVPGTSEGHPPGGPSHVPHTRFKSGVRRWKPASPCAPDAGRSSNAHVQARNVAHFDGIHSCSSPGCGESPVRIRLHAFLPGVVSCNAVENVLSVSHTTSLLYVFANACRRLQPYFCGSPKPGKSVSSIRGVSNLDGGGCLKRWGVSLKPNWQK